MIYEDVSYWDEYLCYFKAGNYKTQKDSEGVKSYVKIHSLSVTHSDSSSCIDIDDWDAFTLSEEDGNGNQTLTTAGYIVIIMGVLVVITFCGFAGYCYYKKKCLSAKGAATFKDSVDDAYKAGDTPKSEEKDENMNKTQTGAYDMEEIEIDGYHI